MSTSVAQTISQLRCELGQVLHTDWTQRRIICERGDLVRDLKAEDIHRQGREVRVPPELWSAYRIEGELPEEERPPINTWGRACEVLGISRTTLNRVRKKHGDTTEAIFTSEAAVRRWWRGLQLPAEAKKDRRGAREKKSTTLEDLTGARL